MTFCEMLLRVHPKVASVGSTSTSSEYAAKCLHIGSVRQYFDACPGSPSPSMPAVNSRAKVMVVSTSSETTSATLPQRESRSKLILGA